MSVLPLASTGTVVSSPCSRSAAKHMGLEPLEQRLQHGAAGADLVGQGRQAQAARPRGRSARPGGSAAGAGRTSRTGSSPAGWGRPSRAAITWNGAGAWLIVSQSRQENFSRTCWITFHWRGITSSVSVTSSPSLDRRAPPQQGQAVGAGIDHPLARQVLGERLARGPLAREGGDASWSCAAAVSAASSSSVAVASSSSSCSSSWSSSRARALGARAEQLALELGDLQLQMGDQRLVVGGLGAGAASSASATSARASAAAKRRLQRVDIVGQGLRSGVHEPDGITKSAA